MKSLTVGRSSMEKLERYFQRNFRNIGKIQDNPLRSTIHEKPPLRLDLVVKLHCIFIFVRLYLIIVDEIEIGKGEALFLLLIKVPLSTENLSCNYDLLEINILVHKFINIHGIYIYQSVYFEHKKFKENCNTATKASRMPGSVANFCQ